MSKLTKHKTTLEPLGERIVAKPVEVDATTPSGILLPEQAKNKANSAKVIAVGSNVTEVSVGNVVVYAEHGLHRFKLSGEELLILSESDVLAVVE